MLNNVIQISVKSDLEATVSQWARTMGDQMPYATALALTRTAKAAKEEVERQLPSLIDRPTPYTMRGFRLYPATKRRLVAEVDFRETMGAGTQARDYLAPLVFGGPRKQGYSANITDKRKAALARGRRKTGQLGITYFVGRPGNGRMPPGVWQRISFGSLGSAIKPVILFVTQPRYRQQLDVPGIAQRVIAERFADELAKAVAQAQRTARQAAPKTPA